MSNMLIRSISGLAYVTLVMLACFSGPYGQVFLACFLTVASVLEWMQFTKGKDLVFPSALIIGTILLAIYCFTGIFEVGTSSTLWLQALIVLFIFVLVANLAFNSKDVPKELFHSMFSLIYIGFPMIIMPMISEYNGQYYPWMLASIFIMIWCSDTFAYLVGRSFGKHKLFERISPNKTWEGFFGGAAATFIAALVMNYFFDFLPLMGWLGLAAIVLIFGSVGDLFESSIKRSFNLKDSGNFMPGHGGILDRIDSLLFVVPPSYFYLRIIENLYP